MPRINEKLSRRENCPGAVVTLVVREAARGDEVVLPVLGGGWGGRGAKTGCRVLRLGKTRTAWAQAGMKECGAVCRRPGEGVWESDESLELERKAGVKAGMSPSCGRTQSCGQAGGDPETGPD